MKMLEGGIDRKNDALAERRVAMESIYVLARSRFSREQLHSIDLSCPADTQIPSKRHLASQEDSH